MVEEYDFSATLHTTRPKRRIARLFGPPIWEVRLCTWTDYEITSAFAEFVIEAEAPILLHGRVTDLETNAESIFAPLRAGRIGYEFECYRTDGTPLWNWTWSP